MVVLLRSKSRNRKQEHHTKPNDTKEETSEEEMVEDSVVSSNKRKRKSTGKHQNNKHPNKKQKYQDKHIEEEEEYIETEEEEQHDIIHDIGANNYKIVALLGVGSQGRVYLVRLNDTDKLFAMKVFKKKRICSNSKTTRSVLTEQRFLASTDHPFITKLYHSFHSHERLFLVMEYCPGGELWTTIKKQPDGRLNEEQVRFFASEVLLVLEYVHSKGYIYRDLKPENILLQTDGHIRVADFGLSKQADIIPQMTVIGPTRKRFFLPKITSHKSKQVVDLAQGEVVRTNSLVGSVHYLAPEVLSVNANYDVMADWWAFGVLLYDMFYGYPPFQGTTNEEVIMKILLCEYEFPSYIPIDSELKHLIKNLLVLDPKKRVSAKRGANDIKRHAFFQGVQWGLLRNRKPPIIPTISSPEDISNFELYEDDHDSCTFEFFSEIPENPHALAPADQLNFQNFHFFRDSYSQELSRLLHPRPSHPHPHSEEEEEEKNEHPERNLNYNDNHHHHNNNGQVYDGERGLKIDHHHNHHHNNNSGHEYGYGHGDSVTDSSIGVEEDAEDMTDPLMGLNWAPGYGMQQQRMKAMPTISDQANESSTNTNNNTLDDAVHTDHSTGTRNPHYDRYDIGYQVEKDSPVHDEASVRSVIELDHSDGDHDDDYATFDDLPSLHASSLNINNTNTGIKKKSPFGTPVNISSINNNENGNNNNNNNDDDNNNNNTAYDFSEVLSSPSRGITSSFNWDRFISYEEEEEDSGKPKLKKHRSRRSKSSKKLLLSPKSKSDKLPRHSSLKSHKHAYIDNRHTPEKLKSPPTNTKPSSTTPNGTAATTTVNALKSPKLVIPQASIVDVAKSPKQKPLLNSKDSASVMNTPKSPKLKLPLTSPKRAANSNNNDTDDDILTSPPSAQKSLKSPHSKRKSSSKSSEHTNKSLLSPKRSATTTTAKDSGVERLKSPKRGGMERLLRSPKRGKENASEKVKSPKRVKDLSSNERLKSPTRTPSKKTSKQSVAEKVKSPKRTKDKSEASKLKSPKRTLTPSKPSSKHTKETVSVIDPTQRKKKKRRSSHHKTGTARVNTSKTVARHNINNDKATSNDQTFSETSLRLDLDNTESSKNRKKSARKSSSRSSKSKTRKNLKPSKKVTPSDSLDSLDSIESRNIRKFKKIHSDNVESSTSLYDVVLPTLPESPHLSTSVCVTARSEDEGEQQVFEPKTAKRRARPKMSATHSVANLQEYFRISATEV